MKIAITIGHSPVGGVGTSTYILARGMREAGHQADILATDGLKGNDYDRARRDGWPVEAICLGQRWLRRRLEITLERLSAYDVVINNHSTETQLVLPALPAHIVRLSVIRSTDNQPVMNARLNSLYLDSLVGISPQVTDLLVQAQVETKVHTIPNAVLVENDCLPTLSFPLQIVFVGRLEDRQKNIFILPDVAACLRSQNLDFKFTIVGDGPHRHDFEEKITQMTLQNYFDVRGAMERDAACSVFRRSHFSVLPSHFEGFGLVVAEAMAAGSVPIVSDIPVFRWILGEDAEALVAPVKDAAAYADRIQALVSDPERYRQIQKRLQTRQRECFSPESTVGGYLRLIEELRETHDSSRFAPVPFGSLPLPPYHKRRCSRLWWVAQKIHDGGRKIVAL